MKDVDPKITFWIGLVGTVALVLSNAAIWSGAVPDSWAHYLVAWNNIIAQICTPLLTFLTGVSSSQRGPIAERLNPRGD